MERIMIIGCGGSGKTTFSIKLQRVTNIELVHLDKLFWLPNWEKQCNNEWNSRHESIISNNKWIIDGNYNKQIDERMSRADTIIYFDFPRILCIYNVTKRILKSKIKVKKRQDIPFACEDKFNISIYKWVWNFNKHFRSIYYHKLSNLEDSKQIIIIKNYAVAKKYLESVIQNIK